jgi:multiple sugar transport system substrate-binding protein
MRKLAMTLLACAAVAGLVPVSAARAEATTITVATFPDLDRAAKAALPRWQKAHPDVAVKIVSLQYADHHTAMTTALSTGSGLPDVMAIDFRFIGKFAESGGFEDLSKPPYDANALRDKFVRYTFPQATNSAGALVALPADIGPGTLLYRSDLIAKAGLTEADLTKSWESFIASGVKLKAATGACLLADSADIRDIVLRSGLSEGEGIYFDKAGKVLVDSPRFQRAFELGRAAHKAGTDAGTTAWTNEWVAGFRQNKVASQMMGAWLAGHLKNWLAPDTAGKWRSTVLPGGAYASYGGSFYAIPKKADHKAAAWEFIKFMTADRQQQVDSLRTLDTFPALLEAQKDPAIDEPLPFLGGQKARELWRDIASKVPAIPVDKYDAMATDVIRAEYENVISQGKDIKAALADARSLIEHRARR